MALPVTLSLPDSRLAILKENGLSIPSRQQTIGLIDTGADRTIVDFRILKALELVPFDQSKLFVPGSKEIGETVRRMRIGLTLIGQNSTLFESNEMVVLESDLLTASDFGVLIGMDVLLNCTLTLDGPQKQFALAR